MMYILLNTAIKNKSLSSYLTFFKYQSLSVYNITPSKNGYGCIKAIIISINSQYIPSVLRKVSTLVYLSNALCNLKNERYRNRDAIQKQNAEISITSKLAY